MFVAHFSNAMIVAKQFFDAYEFHQRTPIRTIKYAAYMCSRVLAGYSGSNRGTSSRMHSVKMTSPTGGTSPIWLESRWPTA